MSDQSDREAKLREIAKKRVVYTLPGMDAVEVRTGLTYRATAGDDLPLDIYSPARTGAHTPVVAIPLGYPDRDAGVRQYGPFTSWARLIAASGMSAILYGSTAPADDIHALLAYVRASARDLNVDPVRIGLFATSGSVAVALSALMHDRALRCAALLYGYTMDLDGSTAVADMGRQYGFVDACARKSVDDLPADVPMFVVRAGRDQFPGVNETLDAVIARAIARNLPLTLVNHATGAHGFDCDEDSTTSRAIVGQVLAFLGFHLEAERPIHGRVL